MGKSLSDIVNSALSEADHNIKLASASDVDTPAVDDFLAAELAIPSAGPDPTDAKAVVTFKSPEGKLASDTVLTDASYGMKLASALETAAGVILEFNAKLAMGGDAASPQVTAAGFQQPATVPKAQANSLTAAVASHGGAPLGPQGELKTNKEDYGSPETKGNKEAAVRIINAKVAQAEQLEQVGQLAAAERLLLEAQALSEKVAADPSSPQAVIPAPSGEGIALDTSPGPSTHIGDNATLIALTRSGAKDPNQREAGKFLSETPKKDNAVTAHLSTTTGLKLSAHEKEAGVSGVLQAIKKRVQDTAARRLRGPRFIGGVMPPSRGKVKDTIARRALKAEAGIHTKMDDLARRVVSGSSKLSSDQVLAARAYLQKIASKSTDPNATSEERQKASSLIEAVRARTATSPEALFS